MVRRLAPLTLLLALFASGVAQPASATTAPCTTHVTKLRYRPEITWTCTGIVDSASVVVKRISGHKLITSGTPTGLTTTALTFDIPGNLGSALGYSVSLTAVVEPSLSSVTSTTTWKTLPLPAHPKLRVKYITAIPPEAVLDIAHRMDAANMLAVPRASDFIDASTRTLTAAQYTAALRTHQSALVVTDLPVLDRLGLDSALSVYCNHGHGVVLGGQTHWLAGANAGWATASAIGAATTKFASRWAMYTYDDVFPNQVSTGLSQMAPGSVVPNFLTKGLHKFTIIGPGSGEPIIQDYSSGKMLATLQRSPDPSSPFHTYGQVLLSSRQIGAGRVVDLGFRPWSSAVAGGGFDPGVSPGGALVARSLWWAMNRIAPTDTHFTMRPPNPSNKATVIFALGAKDQDADGVRDLNFQYRADGGRWHWAAGNSFALYHLAQGSTHTVQARAVDVAGNIDAHIARYSFRVTPGALG
jgi:hypothetical protein